MLISLAACGSSGNRNIVVADSASSRELIYNSPVTTNENAIVVLGQPDFNSNFSNQSAAGTPPDKNTMSLPTGVSKGTNRGTSSLPILENRRVLIFKPPFSNNIEGFHCHRRTRFCHGSLPERSFRHGDQSDSGRSPLCWTATEIFGWRTPGLSCSDVSCAPHQRRGGDHRIRPDNNRGKRRMRREGPPSADTLCAPSFVTFDSQGNLWVTEQSNNRVVEFVPPFTTGMSASLVLRQPDFTTDGPSTTASTFNNPMSAVFDSHGNLWVTDQFNNRALEFKPPFSNGMPANLVLGQSDFTSAGSGTTASTFTSPWGLAFESNGALLVSDTLNNRVMTFVPPFSNGMSAASALGQPDLTSGTANQGGGPLANTLQFPTGVLTR